MTNAITIKGYFESDLVREKFREVLGQKAPAFLASMLSAVNSIPALQKADPKSVYAAAMIAATLDLPINPNLGLAYIIPYKDQAQFQMGYKGFIQLAQRSGLFETINVIMVKEGEIVGEDLLTGKMQFNWILDRDERDKKENIGCVAYFRLLNGFVKSYYMTIKQLKAHGLKYSQTYKKGYGLWEDNFEAMASKTVIKLLLSKYAPLNTQMQTAVLADQAVIKDGSFEYIDNKKESPEEVAAEKERERLRAHIAESKTAKDLQQCEEFIVDAETRKLYDQRMDELEKESK